MNGVRLDRKHWGHGDQWHLAPPSEPIVPLSETVNVTTFLNILKYSYVHLGHVSLHIPI